MPGRGRGRAKARRKEERARRPGENPNPAPPSPLPQDTESPPPPDTASPLPGLQDMEQGMADLTLEVESQRQEAYGGARPKTHRLPSQGTPNIPRGPEGSPASGTRSAEAQGKDLGTREGEFVYQREDRGRGSEDASGGQGSDMGREDGRRRRLADEDVCSRPQHVVQSKQGTTSASRYVELITNYFSLEFPSNLLLYQYHVDFSPSCDSRRLRMALLYLHENLIGKVHAFDGAMLFIPRRLKNPVTEVYSSRKTDDKQIRLTIRLTRELPPNDKLAIQVFNIMFRKHLGMMGMKQVMRHYYDFKSNIDIPRHRISVIPGVSASILQYETGVLLNVDVAHKLIHMDTLLDVMDDAHRVRGSFDDVERKVIGAIVLTLYNQKTYTVDAVTTDLTVNSVFKLSNGGEISYKDYLLQHHKRKVTEMEQPLLLAKPTARDCRRGDDQPIYLVPEFCILTGLSDEMKADFTVMKDVAVHTRIQPAPRIARLMNFRKRMEETKEVRQELDNWGMSYSQNLVKLTGRIFNPVPIGMANQTMLEYRPDRADWSFEMRNKQVVSAINLSNWIIIFPRRMMPLAQDLVHSLCHVARPIGINIASPNILEMPNDRNETYKKGLDDTVDQKTQLVMCLLPNQRKDRYDVIKKFTVCERPVPSQVVVEKTIKRKDRLMSVATKIVMQINCKLGGELWTADMRMGCPYMIVGIDTYHDSSMRNRSVGGVVCSLNANCTRFYSRTTFQTSHVELIDGLTVVFTAALRYFLERNRVLPKKIFIYRDGVGDGQLEAVKDVELNQILRTLDNVGQEDYKPSLSFIIVKKRINSRFFRMSRRPQEADNPPPGTVVDTVVTNRNWYDFFLVSQSVRQGTVTPTHYNVIHDDGGHAPDFMQRQAYKMTHLYYNWAGTIRVPAPCQYAHKLAFLVGQSIHREPSLDLASTLYYL